MVEIETEWPAKLKILPGNLQKVCPPLDRYSEHLCAYRSDSGSVRVHHLESFICFCRSVFIYI